MESLNKIKLLSDIKLLESLCSQSDDSEFYDEFVKRFLPDVQKECEIKCKIQKIDSHIGIQIAHDTFERVRKYKSFKKDKIELKNDRKGIIAYLLRISTCLFYDHYKHKKKTVIHRTYFDDLFDTYSSKINVNQLKTQKDIAIGILKKLNKNEQRVFLTDLDYKRHSKYLPDDVTESLATELGIKKDYIRRIRKRAIEKINKAIDEINSKER